MSEGVSRTQEKQAEVHGGLPSPGTGAQAQLQRLQEEWGREVDAFQQTISTGSRGCMRVLRDQEIAIMSLGLGSHFLVNFESLGYKSKIFGI